MERVESKFNVDVAFDCEAIDDLPFGVATRPDDKQPVMAASSMGTGAESIMKGPATHQLKVNTTLKNITISRICSIFRGKNACADERVGHACKTCEEMSEQQTLHIYANAK
jgi:hypothetical protein